ncbi:glycosyltransferase [Sulfuritalea sp.]|uniref:glycosyltransferase family protein n=1 Tax=Sulfuritalea sp. TaxID=2480090 RepID=UPI001AC96DCB|nr:glycosyltransferase [Sulfuritalea sp.]MBN8475319.1 glycosyltransferase [Sulfuritalea sp.]
MTVRDVLLIAHGSLHPALRRELAARGLVMRESRRWQDADRSDPDRMLGAYTWFYEGLRHPLTVWGMSRFLRRRGIPLFAWNQDAPHYLNRAAWRLDWLDRARLFDLYATHSLMDARRNFADSVLYLPNAADTARYHLHGATLAELRDPARYEHDVSFFGAMDGSRYKEMRGRQEFFTALGKRLAARSIRYLFREASGMSIEEQVGLIQKTRINLNFGASCDYGAPLATGLPERCYGIPACGGFLLCDKRRHARDDFTPGDNWAEFEGLDDCLARIEFWLANFAAARDLAERCHTHVMARHTYAHRAATLHDALLAWHGGKRGRLQ